MHHSSTSVAALRVATVTVLAGASLLLGQGVAQPAAGEPDVTWLWPLEPAPPAVVHGFAGPPGPYAAGHRGLDLASRPGQPVFTAGAGVVAFSGMVAGRPVVAVAHPGGLRTTYEPVDATVSAGSSVRPGDRLGMLSAAPGHCLPGSCLHWGVRRGADYLDPLVLMGAGEVRLLPLWASAPPLMAPPGPRAAAPERAPDRGPLLARG
jgi:murein DD-endopeptidase MepM/ murein hydrolase activator NlpD